MPTGDLVLNDVIEWYEEWIAVWRATFRQAEADKAGIRAWGIADKELIHFETESAIVDGRAQVFPW